MKPGHAIGLTVALLALAVFVGQQTLLGQPTPPPIPPAEQPTPAPTPTDQPPPVPAQEQPPGVSILTSGPVNEAFAEPVSAGSQAGLVVAQQPPDPIPEQVPTEAPAGENVVWIPGYWAWEADQNDFVWVSGCWRVGPPGMSWVPGYWAAVTTAGPAPGVNVGAGPVGVHVGGGVDVHVGGLNVQVGGAPPPVQVTGWEWVPGFWAPAGAAEVQYLPTPPAVPDFAPPGAPPSPDDVWVPGCPYWYQGQYVNRAGYWQPCQAGWVWSPSHYLWTPRGYVFCGGYWDYSVDRRGVLFCPARFDRGVLSQAGFSFLPSVVVDLGGLVDNLFACPRYGHYFFGDYYDASFSQMGIYPCYEGEGSNGWYDPIYNYDRWRRGKNAPTWDAQMKQQYDARRADKNLRPPRTYTELETRRAGLGKLSDAERKAQGPALSVARSFKTVVADKTGPTKFAPVTAEERKQHTQTAAATHQFRQSRAQWESAGGGKPAVEPKPEVTTRVRPVGKGSAGVINTAPTHTTTLTKPETVKIPPPTIVSKEPTRAEDRAPARPTNENSHERK